MEDFSTLRRPLVPVAANLVTVAVVVMTMAWSGMQRPAAIDTVSSATQAKPVPPAATKSNAVGVDLAAVNARISDAPADWATSATHRAGNGSANLPVLKPVGYQPIRSAN